MIMDTPIALNTMDRAGSIKPAETVRLCYNLTGISVLAGVEDYTEGIYNGNPRENYLAAQKRQHEYLPDELEAGPGFRLLEIGCGLGTLLTAARGRGIDATGVTISEDQWTVCRTKKLPVLLANYRELPQHWRGKFDGIIVNGALEHFCQPEDALKGLQDGIYSDMFRICSSLLDPASSSRRLVTTALHFRGKPVKPDKFLKSPLLQLFDSTGFHFSILHRGYGGYYPAEGQLERCSQGNFMLIREVDGTQDYGFTAEDWLRKFQRALLGSRFGAALARHFISNPIHTLWFMASFIGPASQLWQFRGSRTPVRHFRHTWQAV
jgi:cyclopropane fatty-acyl-phospholipid synthase-like methyltransferase